MCRYPKPSVRGAASAAAFVVLAAAVVAAFLPVSDNGFVQLDDDKNFEKNPFFRGLGREQVAWAWTTRLVGVYQPLGWMVLEAQYSAWGLDPRGYHLASLALHALITVALYALTVALIARCRPDLERAGKAWLRIFFR